MRMEFDPVAGAIYVQVVEAPYAYSRDLNDSRRIDFAEDGRAIGIELLSVSQGVDLDGLPCAGEIERLLHEHGITVQARVG